MSPNHGRTLLSLTAVAAVSLLLGQGFSARGVEPVYGPVPAAAPHTIQAPVAPSPHPVVAPSEADRVAREMARTDRVLADADGRVTRSSNGKSKDDMKTGRERQVEARAAAEQAQYARAMRLTLEARAYVKSALTKAGPPENDPAIVGRALEQTDDALERAEDVLEDGAPARLRRNYQTLRGEQAEARRLYKRGSIRGAYAITRDVRDGVLELLRQCENLPVSKEVARTALKRAEEAMVRTKKEMGRPVPAAVRIERNAKIQLQKARAAYARKSYRDALLHAKLVERHLQRAMDLHRLATNGG